MLARMAAVEVRGDADAMLDGFTRPRLADVAAEAGVPVRSRDSKAEIRRGVVQQVVGFRLEDEAVGRSIRSTSDGDGP